MTEAQRRPFNRRNSQRKYDDDNLYERFPRGTKEARMKSSKYSQEPEEDYPRVNFIQTRSI